MSPEALEQAFKFYPDTKLVVIAHLYGTPGKMEELKRICDKHGALIVEDAAESLGAKYKLNGQWVETGTLGDYNCISFNGNKIITGSAGGMFLTDSLEDAFRFPNWREPDNQRSNSGVERGFRCNFWMPDRRLCAHEGNRVFLLVGVAPGQ